MASGGDTLNRELSSPPRMVRFFITLPEPLAIPDGYVWHKSFDHSPEQEPVQQFVNLVFMQSNGISRARGSMLAALEAVNRITGSPGTDGPTDMDTITGQYTTVVATTIEDRTPDAASRWDSPQDIPAEYDPLNRCIEEIAHFTRSYRAALEAPCIVPTYEKLGPMIPYEIGHLVPVRSESGEETGFRVPEWSDGGTLVLDHVNFSDFPAGNELEAEHEGRVDHYGEMLRRGNPLILWRERFIEARTALYREGRYGTAVTLSNTASEVLLDGLLSDVP